MIKNDRQLGAPFGLFSDTKANIEAIAGVEEGATAYATDSNEFGTFNGATWDWGQGGSFDLPAAIHGADEKATIHDDDELPGADSEDAWSLIKWTWRTVKTWLFGVLAQAGAVLSQDFTDNADGWTLGTGWSWSTGVGLVKTPGVESRTYLPGALDARSYTTVVTVTVNAGTLGVSLGGGDGIVITESGEYVFDGKWSAGDNIAQFEASDDFDGSVQGIETRTLRNIYDVSPFDGLAYLRKNDEWVEASAANITVDESGFSGNLAGEDVVDVQALADWVDGAAISAIDPVAPVVITSTTNFVKADYPELYAIKVKLQAPGGGGGGVTGVSSQAACANSGGGGEYAEKFILASALSASETVTIGAVGTGATAGNNNGGDGGNCSFGSHFNVVGGKGGNGEAASATVPRSGAVGGGDGGTGGTGGDLHIPGGSAIPGACWAVTQVSPSTGGASFLGSNTRSTSVIGADEAGITGKNWGSGGTGARSSNNATDRAGGDGAPGRCEIELYIK